MVCDCGISRSYSLVFLPVATYISSKIQLKSILVNISTIIIVNSATNLLIVHIFLSMNSILIFKLTVQKLIISNTLLHLIGVFIVCQKIQ